ncbi:uncharacterized protein LOC135349681 isoform X3 [Halichondria panicea]|uniref:uncharacterized protein LOC135349681 isoform X3 n=1 Tax=Halichondria panicea TaxID=6063 RepID=UPI00312B8760
MLELIVAFLFGVAVTVCLFFIGIFSWLNAQPAVRCSPITKGFEPFIKPQLPQHLEEVFLSLNGPEGTEVNNPETCRWFNLISDFLFRELRDSTFVKRVLMKMINKEFEELLMTKTEGRMVEQLTLRDYFLGTSMPVIKDVTVVRIDCSPDDSNEPQLIEISMKIDYRGGAEMKIDADLVFNKSAYVAVTVLKIRGDARIQFTRTPSTHWSFSFYEEPELELRVESQFEGLSFPRLSSLIESQLRRFIRKKYTLPGCKIRHKPFFRMPSPQDQLLEVYVKDSRLTLGELQVEVTDCSRLTLAEAATRTYCTLTLDSTPYKPRVNLWRTHWPTLELTVTKDREQKIGVHYKQVTPEGERSHLVVVDYVLSNSAAGILIGDVLTRVNKVRVSSVKQMDRLISKSRGNTVLISLQRPPPHFNMFTSGPAHPHSVTRPDDITQQAESAEGWEEVLFARLETPGSTEDTAQARRQDGDSISLCGVGGERGVVNHQGGGLRRRAGTTLEERSASPESNVPDTTPQPVRPVHLGVIEVDPPQRTPSPSPAVNTPVGLGQHVTKEVSASMNPSWNQSFTFNIANEHNYLNICVWSRATDESCDLLVGHVTIPLMDIALECLCTSSGYHHQRYVLVASQTLKPSVSRATLQAKSATGSGSKDGKNANAFAGDIFLRFKHQPQPEDHTNTHEDSQAEEDNARNEPHPHFKSHPFTASGNHLPRNHVFAEMAVSDGSHICDICHKKIWSLSSKLTKCRNCGLTCHKKKCYEYCMKEVPCINDRLHATPNLKQTIEGDFTLLTVDSSPEGGEETDSKVEDREADYGHRRLQQEAPVARTRTSLSQSFDMLDQDVINTPLDDQLEGSNQEKHLEDTDGRLEHSDSSHKLHVEGSEQLGMYSSLERRQDWVDGADGVVRAEPVAVGDKTVLESSGECNQVFTPDEGSESSSIEESYVQLKSQDSMVNLSSEVTTSEEIALNEITEDVHHNNSLINTATYKLQDPLLSEGEKGELRAQLVYVKDSRLMLGELQVEVTDCSRLTLAEAATRTYCTLTLDSTPYKPRVNLWRTHWPTLELTVAKDREQKIGVHYKQVTPEGECSHLVVVDYVLSNSAAGILIGDVLTRVNKVRVSSVKQVDRLISKSRGNTVLISLQRPPPHFNMFTSGPAHPHSVTRPDDITQQAEPAEEWDEVFARLETPGSTEDTAQARRQDGDSISLCGVGGERGVVNHQGDGLRRRAGTTLEERSASPESNVPDTTPQPVRPVHLGVIEVDPPQRTPSPSPAVNTPVGLGQHVTREVSASMNPSWNQSFTFNIANEHNYLNICVWSRATDESCDLLVGHVTIPLMDIALECLCTSSGYHHQRYLLVASQTLKPSVSRATLQAKSATGSGSKDGKNANAFAGDIFLRFKHQPQPEDHTNTHEDSQAEEDNARNEPHPHFKSHPFTASGNHLPRNHVFAEMAVSDGSHICDICNKKIWSLSSKLTKCRNCGLTCHKKKCYEYCMKEVPCINDRLHATPNLKQTIEGDFTLLSVDSSPKGGEETDSKVEDREADYGHRRLQQEAPVARTRTSLSQSFDMLDQDVINTPLDDQLEGSNQEKHLEDTDGRLEHSDSSHKLHVEGSEQLGMYSSLERRQDWVDGADGVVRAEPVAVFTPDEGSESSSIEESYVQPKSQDSTVKLSSEVTTSEEIALNEITEDVHHYNSLINTATYKLKDPLLSEGEKGELRAQLREYEQNIESLTTLMTSKLQKLK